METLLEVVLYEDYYLDFSTLKEDVKKSLAGLYS
jgi:hypothetical protein